jgi:hypothetical protein
MQLVQGALLTIMTNLVATDSTFDPAHIWHGVGTAITDRGRLTTLSDITPAAGTTGARQQITGWLGPIFQPDGTAYQLGSLLTFIGDDSNANLVNCWYMADALTMGNLIGYALVTPAIPLPDATAVCNLVPRLAFRPDWNMDLTEIF